MAGSLYSLHNVMYDFVHDFAASKSVDLTTHEALSGVFGSISLAAWFFLLIPQLIENYKQGSAEGISLQFLIIWFVGDVTNCAGKICTV
ncbi:hypothetical protein FGG08_001891 [Glutinoglossum americanum]|uniref:Vacuolar membrane PQ loop repeat protein n=1 Tax=Glutinoglossum americanum TaxID=1670608 RepID=A0A9P8IAR0_9PEZI|nr:hypothetical protein FGG08_001891 [Glutinoglossum americanum]